MWASMGYQLVGTLLSGFASAVLFWALFGDRLQGGHRRARCPRCAYDMAARQGQHEGHSENQSESQGRWTCPECGKTGTASTPLYRSRKRWRLAIAMAACVVVGLGVSAWPMLRRGWWQFQLPVLWHARLSPLEASNSRTWELRSLLQERNLSPSSRTVLRAVAEANAPSQRTIAPTDPEFAIEILVTLGERTAGDDALATRVLLDDDDAAVEAAIAYFMSSSRSASELFDLFQTALEAGPSRGDERLVSAIASLDDREPRAWAYLFDALHGETHMVNRGIEYAMLRLPQPKRFALMMDAIARHDGTSRLVSMLSAAWDSCMPRDPETELIYTRWALTSLAKMGPEVDDLWFGTFIRAIEHDAKNELYPLVLRLPADKAIRPLRELAMRSTQIMPDGAFDRLIPDLTIARLTDDDLQLIRFAPASQHDRLVAAATTQPLTRRGVWVVSALPGKSPSKLAFLGRVESDLTTTEECRVAARDALRYLGEWTDKPASPK